jgi:hypothetical protein
MARTHKPRLFGDSLPDVTLACGDSSSFVTLKALFRRTGSIHAEEAARLTPELFSEASPVVERQRPAAQTQALRRFVRNGLLVKCDRFVARYCGAN